jgi:hypothetical protein
MRVIHLATVVVAVLSIAGVDACGLESQGLLASDAGGPGATTQPVPDSAMPFSDEDGGERGESGSADPGDDEAGISGDDGSVASVDAPATSSDSGIRMNAEASAPFSCASCAAQMCPSQIAACGQGSDCIAYRDCNETCAVAGKKSCSTICGSMYPGGSSAFGALALCDIGCGGSCVAGLTIGSP